MARYIASTSGGTTIKSIQKGVITLGTTENGKTQAVTAVDVNKSELRFLGCKGFSTGTVNDAMVYIVLTDSTTITAIRTRDGAVSANVSWELTEWN